MRYHHVFERLDEDETIDGGTVYNSRVAEIERTDGEKATLILLDCGEITEWPGWIGRHYLEAMEAEETREHESQAALCGV